MLETTQQEKVKVIKQVLDEVDPMGLLKLGCPNGEYEQEALSFANEIVGSHITWKQVQSVFEKQCNEKLPKNTCETIAYNIETQLDFVNFFADLYQNELLTDKIALQNGSILLKVHDNFVVESICGQTYVNGKFYFDIEDQDLLECFCDFVADDKIVYVQYKHRHFGFHYEHPFRYFKEIPKRRFSLEKLRHSKDIELVFDNKQVIYSAKDYLLYMTDQQIVELMYNKSIEPHEKVLFSPDKRKRIVIRKKANIYSYEFEKLTILEDYERKYAQCYAIWEPDWGNSGASLYDSLGRLLADIAPRISGWEERE